MFYVYTIRNLKNDYLIKNNNYLGLLPKLFSDIKENNVSLFKSLCDEIEFYYLFNSFNKESELLEYQKKIFSYLLRIHENFLNGSNSDFHKLYLPYIERDNKLNLQTKIKYFSDEDIEKIIKMNLELYTYKNKDDFIFFIKHLLCGDPNMKYGIYFAIIEAIDDDDFKNKIAKIDYDIDETIIYYTPLKNLLEHVNKIKKEHKFNSNLIYLNDGWNFGIKNYQIIDKNNNIKISTTIDMTNLENDELDINSFINNIDKFCENKDQKIISGFEVVCQIPLPNNKIFKSITCQNKTIISNNQNGGSANNHYMNKYLKYKKKYNDIKNI